MRVLLLGPTGNLGLRCIPALVAHNHTVTLYVRNPTKLRSLVSAALLDRVNIVVGDATDTQGIKVALKEHNIEAIIDVAGNQVLPWREYVLPKIAQAAVSAAIDVGRERGHPLRVWVTSAILIMDCPGAPPGVMIHEHFYLPKVVMAQHDTTRAIVQPIPTSELRWSLLAISWMYPADAKQGLFEPLDAPRGQTLLAGADALPDWQESWIERIPFVGWFIYMIAAAIFRYRTVYEDVADFLATDLESGEKGGEGDAFVGKRVALKEVEKVKSV